MLDADFWSSGFVVLTVPGSSKALSYGHCARVPTESSPVSWTKQLGQLQSFPVCPLMEHGSHGSEPFSSVAAAVESKVAEAPGLPVVPGPVSPTKLGSICTAPIPLLALTGL